MIKNITDVSTLGNVNTQKNNYDFFYSLKF